MLGAVTMLCGCAMYSRTASLKLAPGTGLGESLPLIRLLLQMHLPTKYMHLYVAAIRLYGRTYLAHLPGIREEISGKALVDCC